MHLRVLERLADDLLSGKGFAATASYVYQVTLAVVLDSCACTGEEVTERSILTRLLSLSELETTATHARKVASTRSGSERFQHEMLTPIHSASFNQAA